MSASNSNRIALRVFLALVFLLCVLAFSVFAIGLIPPVDTTVFPSKVEMVGMASDDFGFEMYYRERPSVKSYKIPVVVGGEKVNLNTSYKVDFTQPFPVRWSEAFGKKFATYEAPGGGFFSRLLDGLSPLGSGQCPYSMGLLRLLRESGFGELAGQSGAATEIPNVSVRTKPRQPFQG